jgi:hypothetical protein
MKNKNKKTKALVKRIDKKLLWSGAKRLFEKPINPKEIKERNLILLTSQVLQVSPFGVNILGNLPYINKLGLAEKVKQYNKDAKFVYNWLKFSENDTDKAVCQCKLVTVGNKDLCDWILGESSPATMKMGTLAGYQNHLAQTRAKNRAILEVFGVRIHEEMMINIQRLAQKEGVNKEEVKALESFGKVSAEEIQNGKVVKERQEVSVQTSLIPSTKKIEELKGMLKGNTDTEKISDLKKRTGLAISNFQITEKHAGILVAGLLNSEVKK